MEIIILYAIYGVEIVKYLLGLRLVFAEQCRKKYLLGTSLLACVAIFFIGGLPAEGARLAVNVMILLGVATAMQGSLWNRVSKLVTMLVLLASTDEVIMVLVEKQIGQMQVADTWTHGGYFIECLWGLLVLLTLYGIAQVAKKRKVQVLSGNAILFIIAMNGIIIALTVAGLNVTKGYITNDRLRTFTDIIVSIAYACLSMLCWMLVYMRKLNQRMSQMVVVEQELKNAQRDHYCSMLKKEEQTRKFRHDVNNHLTCLKYLAESDDIEGVRNYLNRMGGQLDDIQKICYVTGNETLDVMLSDKLSGIDDSIEVEVQGNFTSKIDIEEMDQCVIFSNLIQNALDELSRMQEGRRWIKIHIQSGNNFVKFQVQNAARGCKKIMSDGLPGSEKKNKKNHGIGLKNVREVLEKNNGILELDSEENMFSACVIFPAKAEA